MEHKKLTWKTMSTWQKIICIGVALFIIGLFIPRDHSDTETKSETKSVFTNCMEMQQLQSIEYAVRRDFCKCMRNKISNGYTPQTSRDKCAYTLL